MKKHFVANKITFETKVDVLVKVLSHCVFLNLPNSISQTNVQIINIHLSIKWTEMVNLIVFCCNKKNLVLIFIVCSSRTCTATASHLKQLESENAFRTSRVGAQN